MKKIIILVLVSLTSYSFSQNFEEDLNKVKNKNIEIQNPQMEKENNEKELKNVFEYFDNFLKVKEVKSNSLLNYRSIDKGQNVFSIELEKIRNEYLKSPIIFKTSKGTIVYVSAFKSTNCPDLSNNCSDKDKFFMILTTSNNQAFFIRVMKIINWGFLYSGSKTVSIDQENFTIKAYANASTPEKSRVEIKGPNGIVINQTLDKLGEALSQKGIDLTLSKKYKLAYGNEIVQIGSDNAKFTDKKLLILIPFPITSDYSYNILKAEDITSTGVTFPSVEPNYVFKINSNVLTINKI